jgi:hypothetical protein
MHYFPVLRQSGVSGAMHETCNRQLPRKFFCGIGIALFASLVAAGWK